MMLTIISNDANFSTIWLKFYCCFKDIIFNEGVVIDINFIFGRAYLSFTFNILEPGDQPLPNLFLYSIYFEDEQYLIFFVCESHYFIVSMMLVQPTEYTSRVILFKLLGFGVMV